GLLFIFRGVLTAVSLPVDGSMRGCAVAVGLLEVGIGIGVFTWPGPTLLVLALMIGWWVLFSVIMITACALAARHFLPFLGLALAGGWGSRVVRVSRPLAGRRRRLCFRGGASALPLRGGGRFGGRADGGRATRQGRYRRRLSCRGAAEDRRRSRQGLLLRQPR